MKKTLLVAFGLMFWQYAQAQSTTLTPGTTLPSMSTSQRTTLASPANGTLVFDTNTQSYWYRQSGVWVELPKAGTTVNFWQQVGLGGNEIKNTNTGGFWSINPTGLTEAADNTSNPPTVPVTGVGTRLMWIPSRSAFRVGTIVDADKWSAAKIGIFSFATGFNTQANGNGAVAFGYHTIASGQGSLAGGAYCQATAPYSFALGAESQASNSYAIALGFQTKASGFAANAIGFGSQAPGAYATSMGNGATASGTASFAVGTSVVASGGYSTAMGAYVDTGSQRGSFMIGDSNNDGVTVGGTPDQFVARFNGGFYLITNKNSTRTGVHIDTGGNSWQIISDSTRKEKIVLANGESFLLKLRNLRLGSWNYKNQGAKPQRFYGPMAQEIFAAYGKDKYGIIGNDTTVSNGNLEGLLFIFSQALEKRTQDLRTENEQLKTETQALKALIQKLDARLEAIEATIKDTSSSRKIGLQGDK